MQSAIPASLSWQKDDYEVTCDPQRIDRKVVFRYLNQDSYWAAGIPEEIVNRSLDHSLCFGLFDEKKSMVGFARVVSDYATMAHLLDVFVLPSHRGMGLSKWLLSCIFSHPDLQNLRGWSLKTRDAHGLYRQFGFELARRPEIMMEKTMPNPYGAR